MDDIFVLVEHRQGELRDITFEMLMKGKALSEETGKPLTAVLLGYHVGQMADQLKNRTNKVIHVEDPKLENYNSEAYGKVLGKLVPHVFSLGTHYSFPEGSHPAD